MTLSSGARTLWAKLPRDGGETWLSLHTHMKDAAETAKLLWKHWLPHGLKELLRNSVPDAERLLIFLAAAHDLGKAIPVFQIIRRSASPVFDRVRQHVLDCGFTTGTIVGKSSIPHALASYAILVRHGVPRELAVIPGGHHGVPPSYTDLVEKVRSPGTYKNHTGFTDAAWIGVQDELYRYALKLAGLDDLPPSRPDIAAQAILTGLVIMADWIASGNELFPLVALDAFSAGELSARSDRARTAWDVLNLPPRLELLTGEEYAAFDMYGERFEGITTPRPVQSAVLAAALEINRPGIFIIEAPMGEGKTEAALVAAEIFAAGTGHGGLYFALPTQATSDGIFRRIAAWAGKIDYSCAPRSIQLAHGKSRFNEDYQGIRLAAPNVGEDGDENLVVHAWFEGRKKNLLADFVVGTVDHLLMGALQQKHLALRHLGLAGKVVVIDECHAYDAYMNRYLHKILAWLGTYKTPVIILSATLPAGSRAKLVEAYLNKEAENGNPASWTTADAYPLITYSDGGEVKQLSPAPDERRTDIRIARPDDDRIGEILAERLSGGGCAGVVANTVGRARKIARELAQRFGEETVVLLHSRFLSSERVRKETDLRAMLGRDGSRRPEKLIAVGTQVLEQSLDVDFDILVTDICPMDLLLQRMGRLHRHERARPEKLAAAQCLVTGFAGSGFDSGAERVYGKYLLMNAEHLLPERLTLPDDISRLVQSAYAGEGLDIAGEEYRTAKEKQESRIRDKERRAEAFQIKNPCDSGTLVGWLDVSVGDGDPTGRRAEATVRDGADSVEAIVIQRRADGRLYVLPWPERFGGREIPPEVPDDELAGAVAGCTVKLPPALTAPGMIDRTIRELELQGRRLPSEWQKSGWLKDELFLTLDENFSLEILDYTLTYDPKYGLGYEKRGGS